MSAEEELLTSAGHSVVPYARDNAEIKNGGAISSLRLAARSIWARNSYRELENLLRQDKPDLAHFHNILPLISPAAYYPCRKARVPVVQTLHNYRLFCPGATFFREGHPCEECREHGLQRGIARACYRESRAATLAVALMLAAHRQLRTWGERIDRYIALTEFARRKFIECGLPAEKIAVKPNFVSIDPGVREGIGDYAVFVGQLRAAKGIRTLIAAWEQLGGCIPLRVVGDGPLRGELETFAERLKYPGMMFLGQIPRGDVMEVLKGARFLVFPSECYENFPLVIAEAFACGVPVIASRLGSMEEIVSDQRTGLHFTPGNSTDLASKVEQAWTRPKETAVMGRRARADYEAKYTAQENYRMLMEIYRQTIADARTAN